MPPHKKQTYTTVEYMFMNVLWELGEAIPSDIQKALEQKNYTITGGAIRNLLATMQEKGYISRRKKGKAYVYSAKIPKEAARKNIVHELSDRVFDGSVPLLVSAALGSKKLSHEDIDQIRQLIDEFDENQ